MGNSRGTRSTSPAFPALRCPGQSPSGLWVHALKPLRSHPIRANPCPPGKPSPAAWGPPGHGAYEAGEVQKPPDRAPPGSHSAVPEAEDTGGWREAGPAGRGGQRGANGELGQVEGGFKKPPRWPGESECPGGGGAERRAAPEGSPSERSGGPGVDARRCRGWPGAARPGAALAGEPCRAVPRGGPPCTNPWRNPKTSASRRSWLKSRRGARLHRGSAPRGAPAPQGAPTPPRRGLPSSLRPSPRPVSSPNPACCISPAPGSAPCRPFTPPPCTRCLPWGASTPLSPTPASPTCRRPARST